MAKVAVLGAGVMGLAAAYHALKEGHDVTVWEADRIAGGMAAHFDFEGLSVERFYHFVCKSDHSTFELMEELGIADKMRWRDTSMGYFVDGEHYAWGDPISLLKFPKLDLVSKVRYGLQMFQSTRRSDWTKLENVSAKEWIISAAGRSTYDVLWRRLFDLKFFQYSDNISAAWIWTRIKRIGTSRRSLFQEQLGYIEGGSETLVQALVSAIEARGGHINLGAPVTSIKSSNNTIIGIATQGKLQRYDAVISTIPTPFISKLVPDFSEPTKAKYDAIKNIGVVCVLLKLQRSVTRHFWLNINDSRIDIPGIVEFSNLRQFPASIIYVPYYMPTSHPKFSKDDTTFVTEAFSYLKLLNPELSEKHLIASHVGRLRHAQPVCEPGFKDKIPDVITSIRGLQIADTCFYYPEDRGISESVRYGKLMAWAINDPKVWC